jgi:hypothetical protein
MIEMSPPGADMLPIRFDDDGFEVRWRERWVSLPFFVTAIIAGVVLAIAWTLLEGALG